MTILTTTYEPAQPTVKQEQEPIGKTWCTKTTVNPETGNRNHYSVINVCLPDNTPVYLHPPADAQQQEIERLKAELAARIKQSDEIESDTAHKLKSDLETERMRLAACGTAALGYFDGCADEYKSASLTDVLTLRESNSKLEAQLSKIRKAVDGIVSAQLPNGDFIIKRERWLSVLDTVKDAPADDGYAKAHPSAFIENAPAQQPEQGAEK